MLLACFFAAQLNFAPNPFSLPLPRLRPGLPQPRRIQCNRPVARFLVQLFHMVLESRLPFGVLRPLQIEASTQLPCKKLTFVSGPIPLRSPTAFYFISLPSDQRSRFATAHQVCCPMNLLEPLT